MLQPVAPYATRSTVGSLDMPQLAVPDEQPTAQLLQTGAFLSYIFMLAVDNMGESMVL
jgi:hypothetical protein